MPWHVEQNHPDCPSNTPWAVVKDEDGEKVGCHATEEEANNQVAALYANEPEADSAADPLLTAVYEAFQNPSTNGVWDPAQYTQGRWKGILAVEGVETGDTPRREFAPDSLAWRDLPLPIYWQKITAEGHDNAVIVARADKMTRTSTTADGRTVPAIQAEGFFDMSSPEGAEAHRLIGER